MTFCGFCKITSTWVKVLEFNQRSWESPFTNPVDGLWFKKKIYFWHRDKIRRNQSKLSFSSLTLWLHPFIHPSIFLNRLFLGNSVTGGQLEPILHWAKAMCTLDESPVHHRVTLWLKYRWRRGGGSRKKDYKLKKNIFFLALLLTESVHQWEFLAIFCCCFYGRNKMTLKSCIIKQKSINKKISKSKHNKTKLIYLGIWVCVLISLFFLAR